MIDCLDKYVCSECAGNSEIKKGVFDEKKERKTCSYCKKRRLCICTRSLAEAIDVEYRGDCEPCDSGGSRPSEIITELLELNKSAGELDADLVNILYYGELHGGNKGVDSIYDESQLYCSHSEKYPPIIDGREHRELWDSYCNKIKHQTRFFNNQAIELLNSIFLGLNKILPKNSTSPIRSIKPTDSTDVFYRARQASNAQEKIKICCHPTQELNSPPVNIANAGRMNAIGISVFYAAFDIETCISELRLPVGENIISGQFKLEQQITVLDLTGLDNIKTDNVHGNNENDDDYSLKDRLVFLQKVSAEISKPISPHMESLEYMPTQAFAEYLAHHYEPKIDAVIYSSTQTNGKGKNIVFLNRASKVSNIQTPKNGEYKAMLIDKTYFIKPSLEKTNRFEMDAGQWNEYENMHFSENYETDDNKYLSFVEGSLKLHRLKAINYEVECFDVSVDSLSSP